MPTMRVIDRRHYLGCLLATALAPQRLLAQGAPTWTEADLAQAHALREAASVLLAAYFVDSGGSLPNRAASGEGKLPDRRDTS